MVQCSLLDFNSLCYNSQQERPVRKSLTQQVAETLIEEVRKGNLKPGDRVPNEFILAKDMDVGRSTIREAVKQLVSSNVFEIRRGDGTFVCENVGIGDDPLGFQFRRDQKKLAMDLCEMRLVIETWTAKTAAMNATEDDIKEMERLCKEVEDLVMQGKNHEGPDIGLHVCIAKSTGNSVVPLLVPILMNAIPLFTKFTNGSLVMPSIKQHKEIVDAIKCHDPVRAVRTMADHIVLNRDAIKDVDF